MHVIHIWYSEDNIVNGIERIHGSSIETPKVFRYITPYGRNFIEVFFTYLYSFPWFISLDVQKDVSYKKV